MKAGEAVARALCKGIAVVGVYHQLAVPKKVIRKAARPMHPPHAKRHAKGKCEHNHQQNMLGKLIIFYEAKNSTPGREHAS